MSKSDTQRPEDSRRIAFICPHCEEVIWPRAKYLGLRGHCNKCGGRIALLGRRDATEPQRAEALPDVEESWVMRRGPARHSSGGRTFNETAFEAALDEIYNEADLQGKEIHRLTPLVERTATGEQLRGLRELGATESQINGIANHADAVKLAEILEPPPSAKDLARLRDLGASEHEILQVTTRGEARALADELQETQPAQIDSDGSDTV